MVTYQSNAPTQPPPRFAADNHRPLRVLLVSHTCYSRVRGQPKAEQLGRMHNIDLHVLCPTWWFEDDGTWQPVQTPEEGAPYRFHAQRLLWPWHVKLHRYLSFYPALPKLLKELQPDIIDMWEEPWGLASYQICRLRNKLCPSARIITETEQNIHKRLPFPFSYFRQYTLGNADFAIGRSAEALGVLGKDGYTGPGKTVPNAVDAELFHPMDRDACRRQYQLDGFIVGYAGRLVEEKGLIDLIEAIVLCPPEVRLLLIGDGPMRAALDARIAALGIADRVTNMRSVKPQELAKLFNAMDVFALPSRTTASWKEQFGRVIIEAHACGAPVIGSDSGAIPEVVSDAGLIVPERNPAALAQAIQTLYLDPARRAAMGKIGRQRVEELYTWERIAQNMADIYRSVVDVLN
jgi:glycosyltransferase involved in cell wall biosynthesis